MSLTAVDDSRKFFTCNFVLPTRMAPADVDLFSFATRHDSLPVNCSVILRFPEHTLNANDTLMIHENLVFSILSMRTPAGLHRLDVWFRA